MNECLVCGRPATSAGVQCTRPGGSHDFGWRPAKGRKDDSQKNRLDLLPWTALVEIGHVLTFGARKYKDWNWVHVEGWRARYDAALERHLVAWRLGEGRDAETDLHHLAHAGCCLLFLLALDLAGGGPVPGAPAAAAEANETRVSAKRDLSLRGFLAYLRRRKVDTTGIAARVRKLTRRKLDRAAARQLLVQKQGLE